jgi:hypothetical protein
VRNGPLSRSDGGDINNLKQHGKGPHSYGGQLEERR